MESVNSKVKQSKPTKEQSHLKVLQIGFNCSWHFMCLLCCRHAHLNLLSVSIASMTQEEAISTWVVWKSKPLFPKNVVKCWWVLSEFLSQYTGALRIYIETVCIAYHAYYACSIGPMLPCWQKLSVFSVFQCKLLSSTVRKPCRFNKKQGSTFVTRPLSL